MQMLPIGKSARATRLSINALRDYDRLSLLPAAFVDLASGYRCYRLEQIRRAELIRMLRLTDMPLSAIAEVLDGPDPEGSLASHRAVLALQRDEQERKLEEGPVAAVLHRGPYDEMGPAYEALAQWIQAHGHRTVGPAREIYLNSPADTASAELLTEIQWPIDSAEDAT